MMASQGTAAQEDTRDVSSSVSVAAQREFDDWDDLAATQTAKYKAAVQRNAILSAQVSQLRDELEVWKLGFNTKAREKDELEAKVANLEAALTLVQREAQVYSGRERDVLQGKISQLERTLSAVHEENSLVVCLIDGDGTVFSESYLNRGKEGGRDAAAVLNAAIRAHLEHHNSSLPPSSPNTTFTGGRITSPQIICTIYFNRMGLCKTLLNNNVCTAQNFLDFFIGFNQASPTFCLVDVGDGKEAADAKLREYFKLYARLPQTRKIIFGGAHDNGYVPMLLSLATGNLLHKLVILKAYSHMAHEMETFIQETALHVMAVPGLFLQKKMPPTGVVHSKAPSFSGTNGQLSTSDPNMDRSTSPLKQTRDKPPAAAGKSPQKKKGKAPTPGIPRAITPFATPSSAPNSFPGTEMTPVPATDSTQSGVVLQTSTRKIDPKKPLTAQTPSICNSYYLAKTKCRYDSSECKFAHDYELTPAQINQFRQELRRMPCAIIQKYGRCGAGPQTCFYSHDCPQGSLCPKFDSGTCKFAHPQPMAAIPVAHPLNMM